VQSVQSHSSTACLLAARRFQTTILMGVTKNASSIHEWLVVNGHGAGSAGATTDVASSPIDTGAGQPTSPGSASSPSKTSKRRSVKFNPPNLTQPRAPVIPEPEKIELTSFAKEVRALSLSRHFVCCVYAVFMLCLCCVYAVFMLCLCCVYAVFMLCLCCVYAV
jgi:hypothetical protein